MGTYVNHAISNHGFLLRQGHYTTIDDPKAGSGHLEGTSVSSINSQGDIVGYYLDSALTFHGFLLRHG